MGPDLSIVVQFLLPLLCEDPFEPTAQYAWDFDQPHRIDVFIIATQGLLSSTCSPANKAFTPRPHADNRHHSTNNHRE